jgi:hypothetical protein
VEFDYGAIIIFNAAPATCNETVIFRFDDIINNITGGWPMPAQKGGSEQ